MSTHDCNWSWQFKNIYVHVNNQEWLGWTSQLNLIRFDLACPKLIIVDHGGLNFFWTTHQQQLGWKGWLHLMKSNCVHSYSFSFENEWVEMQLVCFFSIQCHGKILNPSKELCLYNSFQVLSQTLSWKTWTTTF